MRSCRIHAAVAAANMASHLAEKWPLLIVAGLLLGEGSICDPPAAVLGSPSLGSPSAGGGSVGTEGGKVCEGRGHFLVPSLPTMEQHKLDANSSTITVL